MAKIPEFLPLYDEIYDKSESRIDELIKLIYQAYKPLPPIIANAVAQGTTELPTLKNDLRLLAYAYLRARNWHVREAFAMFKHSVAFRERFGVDNLALFPSPMSIRGYDENDVIARLQQPSRTAADGLTPLFNTFNAFIKTGYHSYDKRGLPVAYWVIDSVDVKTALKKIKQSIPVGTTIDDYCDHYMSCVIETGFAMCRYQDKVLAEAPVAWLDVGAPRRNFVTVVVDARGLTTKLMHKPVIDLLKDTIKRMNACYADCIHRVLVVNCPSMIRFAFNIVKPALNEGLQKKIVFVAPEDTALALDRVIGKERVPSFLGGTCNCAGGCLSCYHPGAVLSAEEDNSDVVTENIKLSAGEKHEKAFELVQGEDVVWEFVSTKGVDVRFSTYFYPKQEGLFVDTTKKKVRIDKKVKRTTREDPLVKVEKLTDGADHFMAPVDGILQLVWDNSHSWRQDKPVQMRVYKSAPLTEDSDADALL